MSIEKVRDILALALVGAYVVVMVILGLVPPLRNIGEPLVIQEQMKVFGSLLTGPVGMILGFYFGRAGRGTGAGGQG